MDNKNLDPNKPQRQTAENPSGEPLGNPFENGQSVEKDVQMSQEELKKEQQFKEAQSERD